MAPVNRVCERSEVSSIDFITYEKACKSQNKKKTLANAIVVV